MPRLSMRFLGGYQVQLDGEPVTTLEYDKVRALLTYLAMEADRPHRREALAGLLWPELPEQRARRNLSQALLTLRRALGDDAAASFLTVTPHAIQFDPTGDHWIDVSTFTSLAAGCKGHPHWRLETCGACSGLLERASALYGGPFLQGLSVPDSPAFEEWQLVWRERLHHEATDALRALAMGCAHRALMRALAQSGRWAEALAQYETCRRTLLQELGVDPARETVALYEAIRDRAALSVPFPPLPSNLPASVTPFVGREPELAQLAALLRDPGCRLLTLVGPGGSGKTRLAVQAGAQAVVEGANGHFPDGVYLVPLASLQEGDGIGPAIAQALDLRLAPGEDPASSLLRVLRRKRLLLLLDNYEHLLDGARDGRLCGAGAVTEILGAAPGVQILVTSRAQLNVLAEHVLPLGGMAFPPTQREGEEVTSYDAVALFLDRARAVRPTSAPLDGELEQVGRICRLVEGMPLAILLAASWADVLSPGEIAARLERGIGCLEADLRDLPERQRSMRAVFDASWGMLSGAERDAFARLSVFRGGFSSGAAGAVAGADLRTLRGLVRKSFLYLGGRYQVHELLRQCGEEQLTRVPQEERAAHDRHSAYYVAAVERWGAAFEGPGQEEARTEMAVEIDNVRAAWDWAAEHRYIEHLERAMEGLGRFCDWAGLVQEGVSAFERAAAELEPVASGDGLRVLAKLWAWQNQFDTFQGTRSELTGRCLALLDRPEFAAPDARRDKAFVLLKIGGTISDHDTRRARELCLRSLTLYRELDDLWAMGLAERELGIMAWLAGDYDEARRRFREYVRIARSLGDPVETLHAISWLARVAYMRGQAEECAHWAREYAALLGRGQHDPLLVANGLDTQAVASVLAGEYAAGDAFYEEGKAIYRERGYYIISARMDAWQSMVKVHLGLYEEARALARFGLKVGRETGTPEEVGLGLHALGCVALAEGLYEQAQRQLQESLAAFRQYEGRAHSGQVLGTLACAAYRLGQLGQARQHLCEALRTAVEVGSTLPALHALAAAALLLAGAGEAERATELYALARRYPYVANSCWFEAIAGEQVDAASSSLAPEAVAAAQARGRARDLWATAEQLLDELGSSQDHLE